jgi:gamma-glutamylcyclotransferase (GGCT)/AIG2-like uncharacterized protein YtfP
MFLNGTAMSGQKDSASHAGSTLVGPARTAAHYRFYAVRDEFPGLFPVAEGGRHIVGELYDIPDDILRDRLLPSEPHELEIGDIELDDGQVVAAMLLQPGRIAAGDKVVDIAEFGGFRAYLAFLQSNRALAEVLGRPDLTGI